MTATLSTFARGLKAETAFDVLAIAKRLRAGGKDVVELQIGDSPFPTSKHAKAAGIQSIEAGDTHYCPSPGQSALREAVARNYRKEYGVVIGPENVVIGCGAKIFEQFFCEAFLEPAIRCWSSRRTFLPTVRTSSGGGHAWSSARCGRRTSSGPI
jgi:aspartate aminotransferase